MPAEGGQFSPPLQIPKFQGVIPRCRDGSEPVGGDRYCFFYRPTMASEGSQFPPRLQIPKFQGVIPRCRDGSEPVGGNGYCCYPITMPAEGANQWPPWRGKISGKGTKPGLFLPLFRPVQ